MIGMTDSRAKGEPVPYGPLAEQVVTGFRITLTEPMEPLGKIRFEINDRTIKRQKWDYYFIRCPRCNRTHADEKHHCWLWIEDHTHMAHGPELPRDHPLFRPTKMMKLWDWLESDY